MIGSFAYQNKGEGIQAILSFFSPLSFRMTRLLE